MIVYGDSMRTWTLAEFRALTDPLSKLIAAGEVAQALADARGSHYPALDDLLLRGVECDLPASIEVKEPEGYAFYAVDPQLYADAAHSVRDLANEWTVVGIRSIGTSLGAVVASALPNARFVTVRPTGHPFARELRPSPYEESVLRAGRGFYAIVDEGPGLSGSSFACVASWLEQHGVTRDRIVFFPSHEGEPGAMASDDTRVLWHTTRRVHVPFELPRGVEDMSAGKWRAAVHRWPGVHVQQERRKYRDGELLVKFEGFGLRGDEMFERASQLAAFTPPVISIDRGFIVSQWVDAKRGDLFDAVVRYLTFREKHWPAPKRGASARALAEMAAFNARVDLEPFVDEVDDDAQPIVTDNKLHAWEWLGTLKTDAIDHHASHDLVGCQDLGWDLAGAIIELGFEEERLLRAMQTSTGRTWSRNVMHFYKSAYRAFWYGYYMLAEQSCVEEAPRLRREAQRYRIVSS